MANWRDLFDKNDLMQMSEAAERYPTAPSLLPDCVFISHAGVDMKRIELDLVNPILFRGANGIFLHNAKSG